VHQVGHYPESHQDAVGQQNKKKKKEKVGFRLSTVKKIVCLKNL
jgi:hypothetical protein